MVFDDNRSTVHFDYHVDIDDTAHSIRLDLYTRNARHGEVFLLHQTSGNSSVEALEAMLDYLKGQQRGREKQSYTVQWRNLRSDDRPHISYYYEVSEEEVRRKFFFNRKMEDFEVRITLNPMA